MLYRRHRAATRGAPVGDRRRTRMLLAILQNYDRNFAEAETLVKDALVPRAARRGRGRSCSSSSAGPTSPGAATQEGVATMQIIVSEHPQSPLAQKAKETLRALEQR